MIAEFRLKGPATRRLLVQLAPQLITNQVSLVVSSGSCLSEVCSKVQRKPCAASGLEDRLQKEFESPSSDESAQPIISAEPPEPAPISRLFVIWDDWGDLSLQDRSEVIMNAYIRAKGQQAGLRISVAMGLTSTEAKRMGLA